MALAEDASTPAVVRSVDGTTGTTATTVAFSPPAGSLLVVSAQVLLSAAYTGTPTISISSSNGLTFTQLAFGRETTGKFVYSGFWCVYLPSAATNMTVTMTRSEAGSAGMAVAVRVLTGAAATQNGAVVSTDPPTASTTTGQAAITPTKVGSQLYFSANADNSGVAQTAVAGTTVVDDWDLTGVVMHADFGKSSALTTTTASQTVGVTWTAATGFHSITHVVEIVPASAQSAAGTVTLGGTVTAKAQATASGSVTLGGSASATAPGAASGVVALAGTVTAQAAATAAGAITLGGAASAQGAAGTITLGGTVTAQAAATAAGAVSLAGSITAQAVATAAGSVSLAGSITAQAASTASGTVTLAGSATAAARATTSGLISLGGLATWAVRFTVWTGSTWAAFTPRVWTGVQWSSSPTFTVVPP